MDRTGKAIRITAIIFMGLTAAMNILGGVGTTCAAFSMKVEYRLAFKDLLDYRWLYQGLVVTTILIGIAGIWITVRLVRGGENVYRSTIIVLAIGTILAGIQYFASLSLRGKAAPANVKFYINVFTLLIFLLLSIPGLKEKVDFSKPTSKGEKAASSGIAAILVGVITLTIFSWAGPSHTFFGENWTYVFYTPLLISGIGLVLGGAATMMWAVKEIVQKEMVQDPILVSEKIHI